MDRNTARIIGGIFFALSAGIREKDEQAALETLRRQAERADLPEEIRFFYDCILNAAAGTDAEPDALDSEPPRPALRVIAGGAA